jgi:hypothetical protein
MAAVSTSLRAPARFQSPLFARREGWGLSARGAEKRNERWSAEAQRKKMRRKAKRLTGRGKIFLCK